jgi:2-polyprenyl-3-methyl-5-hydroxy-6-metoxy-1,4-benzoquinol methylase
VALADDSWEAVYQNARPETLPWFTELIDADIDDALKRFGVTPSQGPVLDVGTGPGTFAIEMARRGFNVVATDISKSAIQLAQSRAGPLAAKIEWRAWNLFDCDWPKRFRLIHDRGVYHSLPLELRERYAGLVPAWLRPGGLLFLKAFHPDEPGDWGPHRIPKVEIEQHFASRLQLLEIAKSRFPGTLDHEPKAWRVVLQAKGRAT